MISLGFPWKLGSRDISVQNFSRPSLSGRPSLYCRITIHFSRHLKDSSNIFADRIFSVGFFSQSDPPPRGTKPPPISSSPVAEIWGLLTFRFHQGGWVELRSCNQRTKFFIPVKERGGTLLKESVCRAFLQATHGLSFGLKRKIK